jgi:translation initiation factor IF-2
MSVVRRLSKVAGEFNLGISTIVEFLSSKGKVIETNPNTKIDEDIYNLLLQEYQSEKAAKQQVEEVRQEKEDKKPVVEVVAPVVEPTPKVEPIAVVEKKPEPTPIVEKKVEVVAEVSKDSDVIKAKSEKLTGPKTIGKIDLDAKKKPAKKVEEPVVIVKKEEVKEEIVKVEAVIESAPEVVSEPDIEESVLPEEIETIKAKADKLTGVTLLRTIELPVDKSKEKKKGNPFAKPELIVKKAAVDPNDESKGKRKRIKKVNVENTGKKVSQEFNKAKKAEVKPEISDEVIKKEIQETLARLSNKGKSKGVKLRKEKRQIQQNRRDEEAAQAELDKGTLKLTEFVTVAELGSMMGQTPTTIIATLMSIGIFASINQRLDAETIVMVAEEYGYEVEWVSADVTESIQEEEDKPEDLLHRPPIVTVMGHVDHGKTSLLDFVRKSKVIEGEAGGITQHIGAYSVTGESGRKITFLDTPGHEAFTAMRARGAQVTDVAIIIVAADDEVMPQTKEAINHAQAAGVPMVFAINKIDKPGANPDKIREQLSAMNILVEEWGGKYQSQEVSAKSGVGVEELLEKVLLEAELLDLKANPKRNAKGTVIESTLDKGRGYVTTLLIQTGTLRVGDVLIAGTQYGRIKVMHDEHGNVVKEAGPSKPVSVLGIQGACSAGDVVQVLADEREAKSIANKRQQLQREQSLRTTKHITLDEIGRRLALGDFKELNIIVKGDVDGSVEALADSLQKQSTESIQVNIIHKAVGQISESDVLLASASDAIIVGFQVRPSGSARKLAEKEEIDIRLYSVIYQAIDEIKEAMEGMLSPVMKEEIFGTAEIRETFKITNVGTIAGCFVIEGKINRNHKVRVIRDGIVIYTGVLGSLKRFKDDVKEVANNYECGLNIAKFNDIKVGDLVEAFDEVEVARKL